MDFDAFLCRVVEQQLIEPRPLDVPCPAAFVWVVPCEQKRGRLAAAAANELHSDLLHERAVFHLVEDAKSIKDPIGFRHQRLADFAAWLDVSLKEQRAEARIGNKRGCRRTARSTASHD